MMDYGSRISAIIPSLNPTEELEMIVTGLVEKGFEDIIVVNDGSNEECSVHFDAIEKLPQTTILKHHSNMGKGAALKTAFHFFIRERSTKTGIITVDGDGQHRRDDVVKCVQALMQSDKSVVMGTRDFRHADAPKRNLLGNRITALAFRALFGIKLSDTQTGLRGIPAKILPIMVNVPGKRFDYETNMLLELKRRGIPFREIEIETVYAKEFYKASHYRPLIDSVLIFARILLYALSSVLSFILDVGLFWLAMTFLGGYLGAWNIIGSSLIARVISSFVNFNVTRRLVFKPDEAYGRHLGRYYALAGLLLVMSAGILWLSALLFDNMNTVWFLTVLKIIVDTVLFFLSYYIQREWVFR